MIPLSWRQISLSILRSVLLSVLLLTAINLKDPHFLKVRPFLTEILATLAIVSLIFYHRRFPGYNLLFIQTLFTTTLIYLILGEMSYQYRKYYVQSVSVNLYSQLGHHLIVGYNEPDWLKTLIVNPLVAGIFVTQRNAAGKDLHSLQNEIKEFQTLRDNAKLPPLLVMTDQEGGVISRLSPPLPNMPPLSTVVSGNSTLAEQMAQAEAYGFAQGQSLATIGINVNLSPVVDLKAGDKVNPLDFHSMIAKRAISTDAAITSKIARAYVKGLEKAGITGVLKHFPGLAQVKNDTHHFSAELTTPLSQLEKKDWLPFIEIPKDTNAMIMLSHVVLTQADVVNPVSFSDRVINNLLRDKLKFNGVLITDDLTMAAAYNKGLCKATLQALNAGVDLLLISFDYEKFYDAAYCIIDAYRTR